MKVEKCVKERREEKRGIKKERRGGGSEGCEGGLEGWEDASCEEGRDGDGGV